MTGRRIRIKPEPHQYTWRYAAVNAAVAAGLVAAMLLVKLVVWALS